MAKFYGNIGYAITKETSPGVWREEIIKKPYKGDVTKNYTRWDSSEYVNDNLNINNSISIVADSFAYDNLGYMKFVEWMGSLWKINSIELQRPRIILSIGGVYNDDSE